jgi:hypothetical protein
MERKNKSPKMNATASRSKKESGARDYKAPAIQKTQKLSQITGIAAKLSGPPA